MTLKQDILDLYVVAEQFELEHPEIKKHLLDRAIQIKIVQLLQLIEAKL